MTESMGNERKCSICGKAIYIPDTKTWTYKNNGKYQCCWTHNMKARGVDRNGNKIKEKKSK